MVMILHAVTNASTGPLWKAIPEASTAVSNTNVYLFHSAFNSATGSGGMRFTSELISGPAAMLIPVAVLVVGAVVVVTLTRGGLAYEPEGAAPGRGCESGRAIEGAIANSSGSPCIDISTAIRDYRPGEKLRYVQDIDRIHRRRYPA